MSKPSRNSSPGATVGTSRTFFVTTRTAEGRSLFQTTRMADLFIDVLRSLMRDGAFNVHDFTVMPNHVHILLTAPPTLTVEKAMQLVKGGFSFRARKELGFSGEIWQRGFSEVRVNDDKCFKNHQEYIAQNPVRAGLANSPEEYWKRSPESTQARRG